MNFIRKLFTRKARIYGVWLEIRHNNKRIHRFPVTVACKWKWQAKERAKREMKLVAGDVKRVVQANYKIES